MILSSSKLVKLSVPSTSMNLTALNKEDNSSCVHSSCSSVANSESSEKKPISPISDSVIVFKFPVINLDLERYLARSSIVSLDIVLNASSPSVTIPDFNIVTAALTKALNSTSSQMSGSTVIIS